MWPDTRLCELFGIDHPIIQAPMLGTSTPELAAAVSNAGGLGSVACGILPLDKVRSLSEITRGQTNKPFLLNFFVLNEAPIADAETSEASRRLLEPYYREFGLGEVPGSLPDIGPAFSGEMAKLVCEIRPAAVSFHFGMPDTALVAQLKACGISVISSATNVAEARAIEAAGADAVIAQGWEAGGHRGSHVPTKPGEGVGTMALVPQVVDAVSIPVIATGGIGDARGIAAAFALGASGVQIGSGFLSCPEAATDDRWRALLRRASDEDTIVTEVVSGRSARAVRSEYAESMAANAGKMLPFPLLYMLTGPLIEAAARKGPDRISFLLYGQAAALNVELPAGQLVERLAEDTLRIFRGFAN